VTNITKEHKTLDELFGLFGSFAKATSDLVVLNADDPTLARLTVEAQRVTFGITARADVKADDVELLATGSRFRVGERAYELSVPGAHNVSNALVAIAIARHLNADEAKVADGLRTFQGIARRLARVAEVNGVLVLDDYAHNPAEIAVAIAAARHGRRRVLAVYQPHGFGPTRFVRQELVDAFAASLTPSDALFMPEIYYAGGTADKSLSSRDLVDDLRQRGVAAEFVAERAELLAAITGAAKAGDVVLVMGARDETLTDLCGQIARELKAAGMPERKVLGYGL